MHDGEKKVITFSQVLFDAADDGRAVGITDFLGDYANRVGALVTQGAGKEVRINMTRLLETGFGRR